MDWGWDQLLALLGSPLDQIDMFGHFQRLRLAPYDCNNPFSPTTRPSCLAMLSCPIIRTRVLTLVLIVGLWLA